METGAYVYFLNPHAFTILKLRAAFLVEHYHNRRFGFGTADNRRFCQKSYRRYLRSITNVKDRPS